MIKKEKIFWLTTRGDIREIDREYIFKNFVSGRTYTVVSTGMIKYYRTRKYNSFVNIEHKSNNVEKGTEHVSLIEPYTFGKFGHPIRIYWLKARGGIKQVENRTWHKGRTYVCVYESCFEIIHGGKEKVVEIPRFLPEKKGVFSRFSGVLKSLYKKLSF